MEMGRGNPQRTQKRTSLVSYRTNVPGSSPREISVLCMGTGGPLTTESRLGLRWDCVWGREASSLELDFGTSCLHSQLLTAVPAVATRTHC